MIFLDESIPIRLFLQAYNNLSSTYINVNNKFSVQYYLTLVLVDYEDRRYFKQLEINLCRLDKETQLIIFRLMTMQNLLEKKDLI